MTIAVDLGRKATKQTNNTICINLHVRFQIVIKIDPSPTESVGCVILRMMSSNLLSLRILIYYLREPACEISDCD